MCILNNTKIDTPTVIIPDGNGGRLKLMVDTGSELNIIKQKRVNTDMGYNPAVTVKVNGITEGQTKTMGVTLLNILDDKIRFHIVTDDFPISQDGILGTPYLHSREALVDFKNQRLTIPQCHLPFHFENVVVLPARSKIRVCIGLTDDSPPDGYMPRLTFKDAPHIIIGEALLQNRGGYAYIEAINTAERTSRITFPYVRLEATVNENDGFDCTPLGSRTVAPGIQYSAPSAPMNMSVALQSENTRDEINQENNDDSKERINSLPFGRIGDDVVMINDRFAIINTDLPNKSSMKTASSVNQMEPGRKLSIDTCTQTGTMQGRLAAGVTYTPGKGAPWNNPSEGRAEESSSGGENSPTPEEETKGDIGGSASDGCQESVDGTGVGGRSPSSSDIQIESDEAKKLNNNELAEDSEDIPEKLRDDLQQENVSSISEASEVKSQTSAQPSQSKERQSGHIFTVNTVQP